MSELLNDLPPLNSPTLQIDFRSGNVVMHQGLERWQGVLPMSKADCSQINTARGTVILEKMLSASLRDSAESSAEFAP